MIRRMNENDIEKIVLSENEIFSNSLGSEFLHNELENENAYYFIYEVENIVIGYIGFRKLDFSAEIMNFYIIENNRNNGYGKSLINHGIKYLSDNESINIITLEVRETNKKAINFYEKMGFVFSHIRKNYYNNESAKMYVFEVVK